MFYFGIFEVFFNFFGLFVYVIVNKGVGCIIYGRVDNNVCSGIVFFVNNIVDDVFGCFVNYGIF